MTAIRKDSLSVELSIGGMTCASCAARIEKKLNKLDGVTATVNFATREGLSQLPGHGQLGGPDLGRRAGRVHRGTSGAAGRGGRAGA
jgi:hypothetical protein